MRRILFFVVLILLSFDSKSQIDSVTVLGVNCYNDTGVIFLTHNNIIGGTDFSWSWWSKMNNQWQDCSGLNDTMSDVSFTNSLFDSLVTTRCGKFMASFWYSDSLGIPVESEDSFFITCPITIMEIDSLHNKLLDCYGDNTGNLGTHTFGGAPFDPDSSMILLDTLSGDEYYDYDWYRSNDTLGTNNIQLTDSFSLLSNAPAGWYYVIVSDQIGCIDTLEYMEISEPTRVEVNYSLQSNIYCLGDSTGSIQINVAGGIPAYIFDWNGPSFSSGMQNISYLTAGTYTLNILDSLGCDFDTSFVLSEPDSYSAYVAVSQPIICDTDSVWLIIDSISGGNDLLEYGWSISNTDSLYAGPGTYSIYVFDVQYGCIDTLYYTVTSLYEINAEFLVTDVICFGDSTGKIIIDSLSGGTGDYNIQWGGIDPLSVGAGTYSVFITDSIGCTLLETVTVEHAYPEILTNVITSSPLCYGDVNGIISFNITGGSSFYSYIWENMPSTPGSNSIINNLSGGSYTLSVTDNIGCSIYDTIILYEPELLSLTFSNYSQSLSCFGGETNINAIITGGTGPFSVQWSNGANTLQTTIGEGIHNCLVIDANGCKDSLDLTIIAPDTFRITNLSVINPGSISCDVGGGAAITTSGGTNPIEYIWSTGDTGTSVSNLWGIDYWVIAIDSCGNKDSLSFTLEPYELTSIISYDNITYEGYIEIISTNSPLSVFPPFSYEWISVSTGVTWNNTNIDGDIAYGLCNGERYYVIITDQSNGCESISDTLEVNFSPPFGTVLDINTIMVLSDDSLWGAEPYTYLWSDGSNNRSANFCEGDYWVEVTDVNGCIIHEDFHIDSIIPLYGSVLNLNTVTVFSDDSLWGAEPYTYLWDDGSNTIKANLCGGNHWVEVVDVNGCVFREDFFIDFLSVVLSPAEFLVECDIESLDVELEVDVSGGTLPYTYLWSNGSTENPLIEALSPDIYSVTVSDANNCSLDTSFVIQVLSGGCIPNVFSPNGDGVNDSWDLEEAFLFPESEVTIFGRFGRKVFESVGYAEKWDGTNQNSNDVPAGCYFYYIEIGHGYSPINGTVTILR